ncbi:hypothetical protein ASF30_20560 [Leifsonia sp. Leaf264]|nr:hypothetical protein ASF30_20560 [Leifsonia sp. Leaf264]
MSPVEIEVIVIDGASSDETTAYLSTIDDGRVRWISEPDRGVYDAMNKGSKLATGVYQHFLNAGDRFYTESALSEIIAQVELANHPKGMVVFGAVKVGRSGQSVIRNRPHIWWKHAFGVRPHCHQAIWFPSVVVEALGGYAEKYSFVGDFDLIMRAGLMAPARCIQGVHVAYEGGGMSEQRRAEIPRLLHSVRSERFNYGPGLTRADHLWAISLSAFHRIMTRANGSR